MADQVENGDGDSQSRSLKGRVTRLESDMRDVRETVIEIKAMLGAALPTLATRTDLAAVAAILPTLATKAELAAFAAILPTLATKSELAAFAAILPTLATKAELAELGSRLPARTFLVTTIGILIAAIYGAAGLVLALHQ